MDKSAEPTAQRIYDETILSNAEVIDGQRLVLHEERSAITKRLVEGRRAIITRRIVSERKTIEVDLQHEELQIDYQDGNGREISGDLPESIIVRLRAEECEIVKHVRVVEEVLLTKRLVREVLPVSVSLAHEELRILDDKITA